MAPTSVGAGLLFKTIGGRFMGEGDTTVTTESPTEELFEPALSELDDDDFEAMDFAEAVSEKALKAEKRRRAEERLEMLRLREELGDYELDFDEEL